MNGSQSSWNYIHPTNFLSIQQTKNEDILLVTSTTVDCSGSESAAPSLSFTMRLFVFCLVFCPRNISLISSHRMDRNTCKYTMFWSLFSSFTVLFDIECCIQSALWYCERITVGVIDSFILSFFSSPRLRLIYFFDTKIQCITCYTFFFLLSDACVQYPFSTLSILFFIKSLSNVVRSKPAEKAKIWTLLNVFWSHFILPAPQQIYCPPKKPSPS